MTVTGGSLVYVMVNSLRQASRSLQKISVPGQRQRRRGGQQSIAEGEKNSYVRDPANSIFLEQMHKKLKLKKQAHKTK